jgi:hypothetical protein
MANSMNDGFAASSFGQPRPFPAIVVGGLIVGVLDLAYAIAVYSPRQPYSHSANHCQGHPRLEVV